MAFTINTVVTAAQTLTSATDIGVITANGALVTAGTPAVSITGAGSFLVNDGLISSISFCLNAAADFSLMNSGLMTTDNTCINISIAGVTTTNAAITNTGEIVSTMSSAIVSAESGLTLQNSGFISGRSNAINLGSTDLSDLNRINNSGLIAVQPTSSIDNAISCNGTLRLVNSGTILGNLNLGIGHDVVDNRAGTISGSIFLDDGNNLFLGGALGEAVTAGSGLDTLRGEAGDDDLVSGFGDDSVRGGSGDDHIRASFGSDQIYGGLGDDTIDGGNETDLMKGGTGEDVFVFIAPGDSDLGQTADRIADCRHGDDLIDLQAFAPGVFNFVGNTALGGGGIASFGYTRSAAVVTVLADVNGDGTADFRIEVLGTKALALSDFLI